VVVIASQWNKSSGQQSRLLKKRTGSEQPMVFSDD
jgi:hypothetical protein